ncbi:MAG: hydantoinase/oxoprolinase family protein [Dehalococcoidia bacterium]
MNSRFRVGIDVGGTFTDLVAFDEESGDSFLIKLPSTPHDPSEGVIHAFKYLRERSEREISVFVHASTIGSNLFLGQLGLNIPKGALVTTCGFRDVLEIGRQRRAELYNPFFERPEPLIERRLRFTVEERMNFEGKVLKALDEEELRNIGREIEKEGVETVAVVFLHAYANPEHEKRAKAILQQQLPNIVIAASHEVNPEYREYERMSTTVVNSLLIPVVSTYLQKIGKKIEDMGDNAPLYIMQSNGGLATVEVASTMPVATIESGPATGVTASAYWSMMLGIENILSFDMGGTTAKAGAVINGRPQIRSEYEIGGKVHGGRIVGGSGYPVRFPFIDLAEVSSGGGTIAWVEGGGALRVGPISAGADPGPACYGKGGKDPTVTDANLVLGRLNPEGLAGGEVRIIPELAERSLEEKVAKPLDISLVQAAHGITEIVNNHMMRALRLVSIERGYDPRELTLLAFGGAGPMHAPFLAEGLGITDVIIPPSAGAFSALGLILADFRHDLIRSVMKQALEIDRTSLEETFQDLEEEAKQTLCKEGFASSETVMERQLDLRYLGQSYEITVPMQGSLGVTLNLFHLRHREIYGYAADGEPMEVVNARLIATGITRKPELRKAQPSMQALPPDALTDKRASFFDSTGWIETPIYSRDALLPGNRLGGPAIVEQYDATTVVPPRWNATVDDFSNLRLGKCGV